MKSDKSKTYIERQRRFFNVFEEKKGQSDSRWIIFSLKSIKAFKIHFGGLFNIIIPPFVIAKKKNSLRNILKDISTPRFSTDR